MKKRFCTVMLAMLMMLVCMTVTAFASQEETEAEAETLSIVAKNLSFRDSICIKFAVDTSNADTILLVWSEEDAAKGFDFGTQTAILSPVGYNTIGDATYLIYDYTGLSAKQMTDNIYVRAYLDGEYGKTEKYSILQYAYNKLGRTGTKTEDARLEKLINATLAQGAAAQEYFNYKTDRLATADFYQVSVVGGTLADGFQNGLYRTGEGVQLTAPETDINGAPFAYWADESGSFINESRECFYIVGKKNIILYSLYLNPNKGLIYTLNANGLGYTVTSSESGIFGDIVIPATYNGKPVTAIGEKAFYEQAGIGSITIPESVTSIGAAAFARCTGLTSITLPESIESFGKDVFYGCSSLTSATLSEGITGVGDTMFFGCKALTSVAFPETLASIGHSVFSGCTALTDIYYSGRMVQWDAVVKENGWDNGAGAYTLHWLGYTEGLEYARIGDGAAYSVTGLGTATDTDVIIPATYEGLPVTSIGANAFRDCDDITSITIPASVTSIGQNAFYFCKNLAEVHITDLAAWCNIDFYELTSSPLIYSSGLFLNGTEVTNLVIPHGVTTIKAYAFINCTSLTSITIPDSVTAIGKWTFAGCTGLTSVIIPERVTSIGDNAFASCTLLTSIAFAENSMLTEIGSYAFYRCTALADITIPESVTSMGDSAFSCCTGLASITFAEGCQLASIAKDTFSGCSSLTNVTFGQHGLLTEIGSYAFCECTALTGITIPQGVTSIGRCAFSDCTALASITFPESLTSIEDFVFYACAALTDIYYCGSEAEWDAVVKEDYWDSYTGAYVLHGVGYTGD